MKIVVVGGLADSLVRFRGRMLEAFVGRGHQVTACAPEEHPQAQAALEAMGVTYQPIPMQRTGMNPLEDLKTLLHMVRFFRRARPDIVFFYTIKPVIYGSMAARLTGVPKVVSMVTGIGYPFLYPGFKARVLRALTCFIMGLGFKKNRVVFFQNSENRDLFIGLGLVKKDRSILINGSGVDLEDYAVAPPAGQGPVFLLIARLIRDKGIVEYVEAARIVKRRHPEAVFRLVGPFYPNPTALSKDEVEGWQREGLIEYCGETEDVRPHIARASVYVLPSYREGTPRSILEAMSMGRAIITTDVPGCRETVVDGENGILVPPYDAEKLAQAMECFIREPERIASMGRESRRIAEEKFDVHRVNAVILKAMGLSDEKTI